MKTILLTGATDGIGLETAKTFVKDGHKLILHGRNNEKLQNLKSMLLNINKNADIALIRADLSIMAETHKMADEILALGINLDVIINNAGVFVTKSPKTVDNIDVRFAVNTVSPYIITKKLLPILSTGGRVVNVSSAAQAAFNLKSFDVRNSDSEAYAESKLAIIMWSIELAKDTGVNIVSVNPKSFLGSKMVKEAYGRQGYDLKLGADILNRAALSREFESASGKYFDNDYGVFAEPHPFALNDINRKELIKALNGFL